MDIWDTATSPFRSLQQAGGGFIWSRSGANPQLSASGGSTGGLVRNATSPFSNAWRAVNPTLNGAQFSDGVGIGRAAGRAMPTGLGNKSPDAVGVKSQVKAGLNFISQAPNSNRMRQAADLYLGGTPPSVFPKGPVASPSPAQSAKVNSKLNSIKPMGKSFGKG